MKNILNFKGFVNESVILPPTIDNVPRFQSLNDVIEFGDTIGVDVVEYDEFFDSLNDTDKETAPPRVPVGGRMPPPFFALYHRERQKPMFVFNDTQVLRFIPNFSEIFTDIIKHEFIHAEQGNRREIVFNLPDPTDVANYFSDKDEVMAMSFSMANMILKMNNGNLDGSINDIKDYKNTLLRYGKYNDRIPEVNMFKDMEQNVDRKTFKKYIKYIYMYLNELSNNKE